MSSCFPHSDETATSIMDTFDLLERSQTDKVQGSQGIGVYSFLSALTSAAVVFCTQLLAFLILRKRVRRV